MELSAKFFDELTTVELYELLKARAEIFVVEQNCIYQDLDDIDYRSLHIFYTEGEKVTAYLRAFEKEDEPGVIQMGRVLTLVHGNGSGARLLEQGLPICRDKLNANSIYIEAQCYATGFYEKYGFQVCSDEFLEDGIPHVQMRMQWR